MATVAAFHQWEVLDQKLEKAIATYLDACTALESSASADPASTNDLVPRIDRRLDSFSTCLSQRLTSAHSSIVRTRNKLVSPAHRLPNEILLKIFHMVIYSIDVKETSQLRCEYAIRTIYRHVHALAGVCSVWRRVGLDEAFWSLVPIIEHPSGRYMTTAAQLSLERAPNHRLCLAGYLKDNLPDIPDFITKVLLKHGARFDSINLQSGSLAGLAQCMGALIDSTSGGQVSAKSLSLHYSTCTQPGLHRPQGVTERLFPVDSSRWPESECLTSSLRVLHIRGLQLPIEDLSLRNLTQLTLQGISLNNNLVFASSLRALASSSQLKTLEIISVLVLIWTTEEDFLRDLPIFLPSLQCLYMEDLLAPLIQLTLRSISAGSHLVAINWTDSSSSSLRGLSAPLFPTEMSLREFKIDVLFISGGRYTLRQRINHIRFTLETLPTITSLYLDSLVIDSEVLDGLMPTAVTHEEPHTNPRGFPELKALHISRSHCHDPKALQLLPKVVASHPLEELGIGIGTECSCSPIPFCQDGFGSEIELVWESLANAGPKLRRLPTKGSEISHIQFEKSIWRL
ncbi:unnamed protein product [Rhizoctonia solani]|uniref:F-box domain-containing protein n=1 Tax=Rhizoctonia solani TaxID=456999 RepID=A0A8H2XUU2_9AGAM|nr:unnamed protein product [Rhizoctonia solani]